jgi:drug/metabolite transporter (DMT)-like permease
MRESSKKTIKGEIILITAAILWGSCFIFQKKGMDYIGPFTLGTFRFILGGLVLILAIAVRKKVQKNKPKQYSKTVLIKGGILCGISLFIAATFQQVGLVYTTAGKSAFLTSMEILVVAFISVFIARKLQLNIAIGTILATLGMYLLCIKGGFFLGYGDLLELIGALFWGFQVMLIDKYSRLADSLKLSCIQFMVAGGLSALFMVLYENPAIADILAGRIPILYTAIVEVAICYTLQIIGQKYVSPVIASVTLSLESVFAAIFGAIILQEFLTKKEISGMLLMLVAIIVIQIPLFQRKKKKENILL